MNCAPERDSVASHGGVDRDCLQQPGVPIVICKRRLPGSRHVHEIVPGTWPAKRPLVYLAIPPSLFGAVASSLHKSGCATNARVVVEKPFGRDLASRRPSSMRRFTMRFLNRRFTESIISGKGTGPEPSMLSGSPTHFWSRSGMRRTSMACKSRWPRRLVCANAAFYEGSWRGPGRLPEPLTADSRVVDDGCPARSAATRLTPPECPPEANQALRATTSCSANMRLPRETGVAPFSRRTCGTPRDREDERWAGVPFYIRRGKSLAATVQEVHITFKAPAQVIFGGGDG